MMGSRFSHDFSGVSAAGRDANERLADRAAAQATAGSPGRLGRRPPVDLSGVRIHTDQLAAESARVLNANAYTFGNHLVFGKGRYQPQTARGRHLLAHELAHHAQQAQTGAYIARDPDDEWERDMTGDRWNYYNTREEAEARRRALDPEGTRTRIDSGEIGGRTRYWVMIRRGESSREEGEGRPSEPAEPTSPGPEPEGGRTSTPAISLTFDDGPHTAALGTGNNRTENVLNTLRDNGGIKAGFFVQTGVSIRGASPIGAQLIARMQREGHMVGIHTGGTTDHESHISARREGRLESELRAASARIQEVTGAAPGFVRPPYGASNEQVRATYARLGLTNLLWDIDGDDASALGGSPSEAALKNQVEQGLERLHRGGWRTRTASANVVILYHDIRASTARHLGAIIAHIRRVFRRLTGNPPRFRAP